jgi:hypothetical protein
MLTYRCKISLTLEEYFEEPPPPTPCDLHILKFMIMFSGCFTMGKADGRGVFPNCGIGLDYHIVLGPLFQECPCHGALLHMERILRKYYLIL